MSALRQELSEQVPTPALRALPSSRQATRLEHRRQRRLELSCSGLMLAVVAATAVVLTVAR